jgi:diguanylate cyclase (GGDEF)-like protein/PAS domain S-box-containing protein
VSIQEFIQDDEAGFDPLAELRTASSHPLVRCFPKGALIVFDRDLRYLAAGGLGLAEVGLTRSLLEGKTVFEVFPPDVAQAIEGPYRQALAGHESRMDVPYEGRIFLQRLAPVYDDYGKVIAGFGFTQDVTSEREAQVALAESEERFRLAFDHAPIGMALVSMEGRFLQVNHALCQITGCSASELQASTVADITEFEDQAADVVAWERLLGGETATYTLEKRYISDGGAPVWVSESATLMRHQDGSRNYFLLQVIDISEQKQAEADLADERRRLIAAALTDELTGLPNRKALLDRLKIALARARREGRDIAVLYCDLDGFKRVNDTGGHVAGDAVLVATKSRLERVLRKGDTLARVGGDEFVVIIETGRSTENGSPAHVDLSAERRLAVRIAERIGEALREPVSIGGIEHVITASIGITFAGQGSEASLDLETVIQEADVAMYRAKVQGKDRVAIFESGLRSSMAQRSNVESILRQALCHGPGASEDLSDATCPAGQPTLVAAYQPIFDLDSGRLTAFEALARLTDSDGKTIGPDEFIPIAEESGLIGRLGDLMLDLACRQLASWRRTQRGLAQVRMSVNVSALQVQHASLCDDVSAAIRTHGLSHKDLILELTETALLKASQPALEGLDTLRAQGVGISIDDFGTGYASLLYLATLPISAVKVDRSFTSGLPDSPVSVAIVNAVAALAAELQLECTVEGVETKEQRDALPEGVHLQGWLTGRPQAPDEVSFVGVAK